MKRTTLVCLLLSVAAAGFFVSATVRAEKPGFEPDLTLLANGKGGKIINRSVSPIKDGSNRGIHFNEAPGDGVAILDGFEFADGFIEFDVRGKNVLQQSFVGVAFHGAGDNACDVVYFRPFNFRSDDPVRRAHSVQYVSLPDYDWQRLRNDHPGVYEKAVTPVPDPDGWFHARIVIASPKVSVFVNQSKEPSLVVEQLSNRRRGWVGLWVGNNSGGDFANLKLVRAE